MQYKMKEDYLG